MANPASGTMKRRDLLTIGVPACAAACLGLCSVERLAALTSRTAMQETHRFDVPQELSLSQRRQVRRRVTMLLFLTKALREQLGDKEAIRLLRLSSADRGSRGGAQLARRAGNTDFETLIAAWRPPAMVNTITYEMVEDTEKAASIRVTECVWAQVFQAAGMDGEIGHAAFCYGDYASAQAFNSNFRLERTKTLMQGDDHCNHRWVDRS